MAMEVPSTQAPLWQHGMAIASRDSESWQRCLARPQRAQYPFNEEVTLTSRSLNINI